MNGRHRTQKPTSIPPSCLSLPGQVLLSVSLFPPKAPLSNDSLAK
jgi:hypothetical protein